MSASAEHAASSARRRRWGRWLVAAGLVAVLVYACDDDRVYRWREEVVLSTGERLLLARSVRLQRGGAPFNPFETAWYWRESVVEVREGPADLVGGRYEARLLPMLVERERPGGALLVVAISIYCRDRAGDGGPQDIPYRAYRLQPKGPMQQVPIPDWAWGRRLNVLMPNEDESPPRQVTPQFAERFNRERSRGGPWYFELMRQVPHDCETGYVKDKKPVYQD